MLAFVLYIRPANVVERALLCRCEGAASSTTRPLQQFALNENRSSGIGTSAPKVYQVL